MTKIRFKILILGSSYKVGLTSKFARLATFLKRAGNDVVVVSSGKEQYPNLLNNLAKKGIKFHRCDSIDCFSIASILKCNLKIRELVEGEGDFDIIHMGGITHISKVFLALRKINKKPKTVATITSFPRKGYSETNMFGMMLSAIAYSIPDACIALCNHSKMQLLKWGVSANKVYVIPLFAPDLEWFDQAKRNRAVLRQYVLENVDSPVIFYAARHIPIKGLEYYLLAASKVLKEFNATFIVGGYGPLTHALKYFTKKLGIDKNVIFTGLIHNLDMPAVLYNTADICVSTSLVEQLPTYIMECMAAGKPVIASSVGGVPEIVLNGVNGYLVPPRDYKEAARRIMELLNDPEKAKKMGHAGRKMIERRLNMEVSVKKLIKVYENLSKKTSRI